jgi:invasion protein IalB
MKGMKQALIVGAILAAAVAPATSAGTESAQAKATAANTSGDAKLPPVSAEPETTTASFGDWTLKCQKTSESARFCEVIQTIMVEGQHAPIAQAAIGRLQKDKPYQLTVVLPVDVQFAGNPAVAIEGEGASALDLTWRKCIPAGCFADVTLTEPALNALRNIKNKAFIRWRNNVGQQIQLALSLRGLAQAYADLAKDRS